MTTIATEPATFVTPGLTLAVGFELPADLRRELDAYHADAEAFEAAVHGPEGIHNRRTVLLAGAADMTVRALQEAGPPLVEMRQQLQVRLAELRWQKYCLIPLLLPLAKQAAQDATDEYEAAIETELENMALAGITPASTDAGRLGNVNAAKLQLRQRAMKAESVLSKQCEKNEAATAVRVLEAQFNCPRPDQCRIPWEPVSGDVAKLADLAGLLVEPPSPFRTFNTFRERQLAIELGIEGAVLLPKMYVTLTQLADLLPAEHSRPLSRVSEKHLDKARKLVAKLPPTREVQKFLDATRHGVEVHAI